MCLSGERSGMILGSRLLLQKVFHSINFKHCRCIRWGSVQNLFHCRPLGQICFPWWAKMRQIWGFLDITESFSFNSFQNLLVCLSGECSQMIRYSYSWPNPFNFLLQWCDTLFYRPTLTKTSQDLKLSMFRFRDWINIKCKMKDTTTQPKSINKQAHDDI